MIEELLESLDDFTFLVLQRDPVLSHHQGANDEAEHLDGEGLGGGNAKLWAEGEVDPVMSSKLSKDQHQEFSEPLDNQKLEYQLKTFSIFFINYHEICNTRLKDILSKMLHCDSLTTELETQTSKIYNSNS